MRIRRPGSVSRRALLVALSLALAACGGTGVAGAGAAGSSGSPSPQSITLYTCINDTTIQPVLDAFRTAHPEIHVDLFRAPTGQLNARVAADVRSGGLGADVVWACDPLTQQNFVDQGLVGGWTPPDTAVPAQYRTADSVGAALLYVVAVHRTGTPAPAAWSDLAGPGYDGKVALPDPAVAASALGALGYFLQDPAYGIGFYRTLRSAGAVQVSTPDDVTTGVAQGRYQAGLTIASSAYAAKQDGSPIEVTWPRPGAVAVYEPIALARQAHAAAAAKELISFVTGTAGQKVLAGAGSYPMLPGMGGPPVPAGAPVVSPDWTAIESGQAQLLSRYQQVFAGG